MKKLCVPFAFACLFASPAISATFVFKDTSAVALDYWYQIAAHFGDYPDDAERRDAGFRFTLSGELEANASYSFNSFPTAGAPAAETELLVFGADGSITSVRSVDWLFLSGEISTQDTGEVADWDISGYIDNSYDYFSMGLTSDGSVVDSVYEHYMAPPAVAQGPSLFSNTSSLAISGTFEPGTWETTGSVIVTPLPASALFLLLSLTSLGAMRWSRTRMSES